MVGAIYASWILHPPEIAGTLGKEIADRTSPLTTSLSAAWLKSAGRGEAGILWHLLLDFAQAAGRCLYLRFDLRVPRIRLPRVFAFEDPQLRA